MTSPVPKPMVTSQGKESPAECLELRNDGKGSGVNGHGVGALVSDVDFPINPVSHGKGMVMKGMTQVAELRMVDEILLP